jgi:hypothetical protein
MQTQHSFHSVDRAEEDYSLKHLTSQLRHELRNFEKSKRVMAMYGMKVFPQERI